MSIALQNRIQDMERRLADLEAAFLRPQSRPAETHSVAILEDKVTKLANDVQGIKMRMGKRDG